MKSGFVNIVGKTNAGKSTLLNRILGTKIVIVSDKPQTTRKRVLGVKNLDGAQIVFVDTPGIHDAKKFFNKLLVDEAKRTLKEADVILYILDASDFSKEDERKIVDLIKESQRVSLACPNKIDLVEREKIEEIERWLSSFEVFKNIIPISAKNGEGVDRLITEIVGFLKEGEPYFPENQITDIDPKFFAAEIVREKIINLTHQEIPYAVFVSVDEIEKRDNILAIYATIFVEKDSQKRIIIGKGGSLLKKIGTLAREELELFFGKKVFLKLWVKVRPNWSKDTKVLKELGYF